MIRKAFVSPIMLTAVLLAACSGATSTPASPTSPVATALPTRTPPPTATAVVSPTVERVGATEISRNLPVEVGDIFSTSGSCAICHTNMEDEGGQDVSIDTAWRSTMMANAARDPYWQASVAAELIENPQLRAVIEDRCATCHMPMARFMALERGETVEILGDNGLLTTGNDLHVLAMDGVSCALCHQIREDNLGGTASYSGQFTIDPELRAPDRVIFGPYTVEDAQAGIMQAASGFRPEQGLHMTGATFCATCHTLYTPYVDATGEVVGEFPEQVPYFEWFYSDYRRTSSCQDCHMPEAQGGVKISNTSSVLRSPFALHTFVGGNAYLLEILKTFADQIGATATAAQFEATIARTRALLAEETAAITLDEVRISGSRLYVDVVLENLAGHKFPTAFPSRRAWIHLTVEDEAGQILFESGAHNPDGSIVGNANDEDPMQVEQHYLAIVQPDQVQIYEAILENTENEVTTVLLQAASYRKDNRLLPSGFEKAAPIEDIAVRGGAREDEDFLGGGDEIQYVIDLGEAEGTFTLTVELLYQSVGYRWVDNLRGLDAPEVTRFLGYYDAIPNLPEIVASVETEVSR